MYALSNNTCKQNTTPATKANARSSWNDVTQTLFGLLEIFIARRPISPKII